MRFPNVLLLSLVLASGALACVGMPGSNAACPAVSEEPTTADQADGSQATELPPSAP